MSCHISVFGDKEEIPAPERILPLSFLANALREARNKKILFTHLGLKKESQDTLVPMLMYLMEIYIVIQDLEMF